MLEGYSPGTRFRQDLTVGLVSARSELVPVTPCHSDHCLLNRTAKKSWIIKLETKWYSWKAIFS